MKIKKGFRLRSLGKEYILVGTGSEQVNFNKMIALNGTAAYLFRGVSELEDFDARVLADLLLKEYEVDEQTALADSESIIQKWIEAGIVEQ